MAQKEDIVINQGATFNKIVVLVDMANNPLNIAGFVANCQMKKWYTSLTAITLNTTVNVSNGTVLLNLPATATSNIVHGRYVYDVIMTDPANNVVRVVEGVATVTPGVTGITIETTANTYNANTDFVVVPLDQWANTANT